MCMLSTEFSKTPGENIEKGSLNNERGEVFKGMEGNRLVHIFANLSWLSFNLCSFLTKTEGAPLFK